MATAKKETLKTSLRKYEKSTEDKKADMKGAKKLQAKDNAKRMKKGK